MTVEAFRTWKPQGKTEHLINAARNLLENEPRMTLRHLFHQLVGDGVLNDTHADYKRLGRVTSEARMAGLLDWDYLGDTDPGRILQRGQSGVEVWVERDSLLGLACVALADLDVTIVRFRAFPSVSLLHDVYARGSHVVLLPVAMSDRDRTVDLDLTERLGAFGVGVGTISLTIAEDIEREPVDSYVQQLRRRVRDYEVGPAHVWPPVKAEVGSLSSDDLERIMDQVGETTRASTLKRLIRDQVAASRY